MELLQSDLSARTNPRLDGNEEPCALIKVIIPAVEGMQFEGWVIGNVQYRPGEYQVYVPSGTKKITFRHPDYAPGEIRFTLPIEGKCTYRVILAPPQKTGGLESVEQGDAAAMLKQAKNYEQGTGSYSRNIEQAQEWYEKAAEAGNVEAQEYLAEVLYKGTNGFAKNTTKALRWNEECAKRGKEPFIHRTAELYKGLNQNEQAIKWYKKYNELHPDKDLQMLIAQLHSKDHPDRNKWLKTAADNGHVEAAYELATRLAPIDASTATFYYQKAINAGHVKAMNDYGTILITGKYGFEKNDNKGSSLINQAISKGSIEAASSRLSSNDVEMAKYVAQIPELLDNVKQGDVDAIFKLLLVYRALGDSLMVEKMRVIALYNMSFDDVPYPISYDSILLEKANLPYSLKWGYDYITSKATRHYYTSYSYLVGELRRENGLLAHFLKGDQNFARALPILMQNEKWWDFSKDLIERNKNDDQIFTAQPFYSLINSFKTECMNTRYMVGWGLGFNAFLEKCVPSSITDSYDKFKYVKYHLLSHIIRWATYYNEIDCQNGLLNNPSVLHYIDLSDFTNGQCLAEPASFRKVLLQALYTENEKRIKDKTTSSYIKKRSKEANKRLATMLSELETQGEKTDSPSSWLRQLKEEGYLWTPEVVAKSKAITEVRKAREEKKAEEKAAEMKQKAHQTVVDGIRSRGKEKNYKTFEVKGVLFNMICIKPNSKANYGDWNSGTNISAPKATYYLAETEITEELWYAVMGQGNNDSQRPHWINDFNKRNEFQTFITKLNKLTGKRFRIPTIEEWEYAAHDGEIGGTPYIIGRNLDGRTFTPYNVTEGSANKLGFYYMQGGVMEIILKNGHMSFVPGYLDHFGLRLALSAQ